MKAVIFDMGGVLLRTEDRASREQLAARFGMTYEQMDALVFGGESAARATVGEIDEPAHWDALMQYFHLTPADMPGFKAAFWGGDRHDEQLVDYIRSLRPRCRTGLLSNAWTGIRGVLDRKYHLLDAFDEVVISAEVKLAKPDARIYHLMLDRLGVQPQDAAFVDDFPVNVEAANALGIHGIRFYNREQTLADLQAWLAEGQE